MVRRCIAQPIGYKTPKSIFKMTRKSIIIHIFLRILGKTCSCGNHQKLTVTFGRVIGKENLIAAKWVMQHYGKIYYFNTNKF